MKNLDPTSNKLYCTALAYLQTQEPGLGEVNFEPSHKGDTGKTNMLKPGRNTQKKASCIIQSGLAYGCQHLERETWNSVLKRNQ